MKEIKFVHNSMYSTAMKFAKRFVSKNGMRMVLQLVHHREDGSIAACDSHKGMHIENMHGFEREWLVNPHTMEFATGDYVKFMDIIPKKKEKPDVTLNEKSLLSWAQMHKGLTAMTKSKNEFLTFEMGSEGIVAKSKLGLTLELPSFALPSINLDPVAINTIYMWDALELFVAMKSEFVDIYHNGSMSVMLLDNRNGVRVVLLPVRTY